MQSALNKRKFGYLSVLNKDTVDVSAIGGNGQLLLPDGTAAAPAEAFQNEPASGFYRPATNEIGVSIDGIKRMRWTTAGVDMEGFSVENANALEAKSIDLSTEFKLQAGAVAGKILTSDTNGVGTWQDPDGIVPDGTVTNQILQWDNSTLEWLAKTNVTLPGTFTLPDGTVGNLSIRFVGDGTSGIFLNGAGIVALVSGGTTRFGTTASGASCNGILATVILQASSTISAASNITSSGGNVTATTGNVSAGGTVTGGTGVTATTGNVVASSGNVSASAAVSAGTTVTGGTGVTATTGDVTATSGNVTAPAGSITAGSGLTTASLTSSGQVVVTDAVRMGDGTAASPAVRWISDPNSGFYLISGDTIGIATGGVESLRISGSVLQSARPFRAADGSAVNPSHTFTNATGSGLYRISGDSVGMAIGSTLTHTWATGSETITTPLLCSSGGQTAPSLSTSGDTNTGVHFPAADQMAVTVGGTTSHTFSTSAETITKPLQCADGSASAPSYAYSNDTGLGTYRAANDELGVAVNATKMVGVTTSAVNPGATDSYDLGGSSLIWRKIYGSMVTSTGIATKTSNQTISTGTNTLVTWTTSSVTGSLTFSSNAFVAGVAGRYLFTAVVEWDGAAPGALRIGKFWKNASSAVEYAANIIPSTNAGLIGNVTSLVIDLAASDTIGVYCYHDRGSNLQILGSSGVPMSFGAALLSAS